MKHDLHFLDLPLNTFPDSDEKSPKGRLVFSFQFVEQNSLWKKLFVSTLALVVGVVFVMPHETGY